MINDKESPIREIRRLQEKQKIFWDPKRKELIDDLWRQVERMK